MIVNIKYPTCWDEVTRDHLLIFANLMTKELTREELLFTLLCKIAKISPRLKPGIDEETTNAVYYFRNKHKGNFTVPVYLIREACEQLSFMIDTVGLPECPILAVNTKLHEVSFKAYYFADAFLIKYQSSKQESLMIGMYEALTGIKRKSLPIEEINSLIIWWAGVKEYLKGLYPEVLRDGDESTEDKTPADILHDILSVLNKNEPHMNKEILASDVHAVMHSLNNIYLMAKQHDNK